MCRAFQRLTTTARRCIWSWSAARMPMRSPQKVHRYVVQWWKKSLSLEPLHLKYERLKRTGSQGSAQAAKKRLARTPPSTFTHLASKKLGAFDTSSFERARTRIVLSNQKTMAIDRKSTRLNSSHLGISYAVFCL